MHKSVSPDRQSREVPLLTSIFICASVLFGILATLVVNGITDAFDTTVLLWINQHASPAFDAFFVGITQLGGVFFVATISLLLTGYLVYKKRYWGAVLVAAGMAGAALLNVVLKAAFERSRPDLWEWVITETSLSFPSGHATASMALGLIMVLLLWRTKWRVTAICLAAAYVCIIGLSRLYLGVHYPTDILGGWLLSLLWVSFVALGCLVLRDRRTGRRKIS